MQARLPQKTAVFVILGLAPPDPVYRHSSYCVLCIHYQTCVGSRTLFAHIHTFYNITCVWAIQASGSGTTGDTKVLEAHLPVQRPWWVLFWRPVYSLQLRTPYLINIHFQHFYCDRRQRPNAVKRLVALRLLSILTSLFAASWATVRTPVLSKMLVMSDRRRVFESLPFGAK